MLTSATSRLDVFYPSGYCGILWMQEGATAHQALLAGLARVHAARTFDAHQVHLGTVSLDALFSTKLNAFWWQNPLPAARCQNMCLYVSV